MLTQLAVFLPFMRLICYTYIARLLFLSIYKKICLAKKEELLCVLFFSKIIWSTCLVLAVLSNALWFVYVRCEDILLFQLQEP